MTVRRPVAPDASQLAPDGSPVAPTELPSGAVPTEAIPLSSPPTAAASLAAAIEACSHTVQPLMAALMPHLTTIPPSSRRRYGGVGPDKQRAMPMLAALLRSQPGLAAEFTADALDLEIANVAALRELSATFSLVCLALDDTGLLAVRSAWHKADVVYSTARTRAKRDKVIALRLKPIREVLAQGARDESAAHTAVNHRLKADAAEGRATRARQKADAATARAAAARPARTRNGRKVPGAGGTSGDPGAGP